MDARVEHDLAPPRWNITQLGTSRHHAKERRRAVRIERARAIGRFGLQPGKARGTGKLWGRPMVRWKALVNGIRLVKEAGQADAVRER